MDLGKVIDWRKFQNEERRADESHGQLMGLAQTIRENIPDGIQAIVKTAEEAKRGTGAKTPAATQPQLYECGQCHEKFGVPPGEWEKVACPKCQIEYTREEVLGA